MERLKRIKKYMIVLLIMTVVFMAVNVVKAVEFEDPSSGNTGSNYTMMGDNNGIAGLRVAVLDENGILKEGTKIVDLINKNFFESANDYTYYLREDRKSLVQYNNGATLKGWSVAGLKKGKIQNSSDIYYITDTGAPEFGKFVLNGKTDLNSDIYNYLRDNGYANLTKIVKKTGYKCLENATLSSCSKKDYISVEIIFEYNFGTHVIGTGYEIAKISKNWDSKIRYLYSNVARLLYIDSEKTKGNAILGISPFTGVSNYWSEESYGMNTARNHNVNIAYPALKNSTVGAGMTLIKVSDVIHLYQCEIAYGKYYGKVINKVVDKAQYETECLNKTYKLEIIKQDEQTKKPINSSSVGIKIYINSDKCDDNEATHTYESSGFGQVKFENIKKEYFKDGLVFSVEEVKTPKGYLEKANSCVYSGNLSEQMQPIIIYNTKDGCPYEFDSSDKSSTTRYELYEKYKNIPAPKGGNFTNLLNTNIMTGEEACTEAKCDYPEFPGGSPGDDSSYCMTGGIALQQDFNQRNMACFDNRLVDGDNRVVGLCSSKLIISRPIDIKTDTFHYIKKGLPIFITNYPIKQTIETTCYSFDGSYKDTYKLEKEYDNKNSTASLKYLGKEQINTKTSDYNVLKTYNNGYVFTSTINYYLKPIFLKIGIGTNNSSGGTNVYPGKYGIMSKLTDDLELSMDNFKKIDPEKFGIIKFTATLPLISSNESITLDGECKYSFQNSLYPPPPPEGSPNELNIQFRTIDVNNPFPGKDGKSNRPIGSNWRGYCIPRSNTDSSCDYELNEQLIMFDLNKDGKISTSEARLVIQAADISNKMGVKLIETQFYYLFSDSGETNDINLDLNDDGIVNYEDARLFERLDALKISVGTKGDNYIDAYIKNAVNSYGRDGSGDSKDPIYTLILTPSDIRQIRKYNSYTSYDDYISMNEEKCDEDNLSACDNEDTFRMKFIDGLKKGVLEFKKKSSLNLSNKLEVLEN